jgi:hypothetical protein
VGVTGFFIDISPSDRSIFLGSTQPLVKMSTRNIPGDKGGRCVRLTTSPPSRAECHEIWEPKPPANLSASPGLLRDCFSFNCEGECAAIAVGIATRCGLDGPGIESRLGTRFSATVQTGPGAQPVSYTMVTGSFPGVKRPGRLVDHTSLSSVRFKEKLEL